jgi:rod shape-determining protein MreD
MRNWIFLLIVFIFALFQTTILDYLKIFGVKPNLFLISIVLAGIYFEWRWALFISLFSGILGDILGINRFGINTLIFALLCFLVIQLNKKLSLDNYFLSSIVTFICALLYAALTWLISLYLNNFIPPSVFLRIAFFETLYTSIIFIILQRCYHCVGDSNHRLIL